MLVFPPSLPPFLPFLTLLFIRLEKCQELVKLIFRNYYHRKSHSQNQPLSTFWCISFPICFFLFTQQQLISYFGFCFVFIKGGGASVCLRRSVHSVPSAAGDEPPRLCQCPIRHGATSVAPRRSSVQGDGGFFTSLPGVRVVPVFSFPVTDHAVKHIFAQARGLSWWFS